MLAWQTLLGKGKRLRYLCQDETRVGLKSQTRRVITAKGVKPIAPVQCGRDNFWIYGVVEPLNGWHFAQEYDHLNSDQFQSFLDALKAGTWRRLGTDSMRPSQSASGIIPELGGQPHSRFPTRS